MKAVFLVCAAMSSTNSTLGVKAEGNGQEEGLHLLLARCREMGQVHQVSTYETILCLCMYISICDSYRCF